MEKSNIQLLDCNIFSSSRNVGFHSHKGIEIIYIQRGSCIVETKGNRFECLPGDMITLPAGVSHNQINNGHVTDYFCVFLNGKKSAKEPETVHVGKDGILETFFLQLKDIHNSSDKKTAAPLLSALLARTEYLKEKSASPLPFPEKINDILEYIKENFADHELSLDKIAAENHLSKSSLKQLFAKHIGRGPVTVLREIRIRKAGQLLFSPYLQIQEVAEMCGFDDPDYFSRVFKKFKGCTPAEYRGKNNSAV